MAVEHLPLDTLGPGGLVVAFVLMVLLGRLIPRRTLEDMKEDRDHWRTAHSLSEAARQEASSQVQELLEHARTTDQFIRSVGQAAGVLPPRTNSEE